MGFMAQWLIVYPERDCPVKGHTMWCSEERFDFGHITRFEKLQMPRIGDEFRAWDRASICVTRVAIEYIVECLRRKTFDRSLFAPPFLIYEDGVQQRNLFQTLIRQRGRDHIDPGMRYEAPWVLGMYPTQDHMKGHNAKVALTDAKLARFASERYCIEISQLVAWAPCAKIAARLKSEERKKTPLWQELQKRPLSLALAKAYRAYLREIGKADARMLFIFPSAIEGR